MLRSWGFDNYRAMYAAARRVLSGPRAQDELVFLGAAGLAVGGAGKRLC